MKYIITSAMNDNEWSTDAPTHLLLRAEPGLADELAEVVLAAQAAKDAAYQVEKVCARVGDLLWVKDDDGKFDDTPDWSVIDLEPPEEVDRIDLERLVAWPDEDLMFKCYHDDATECYSQIIGLKQLTEILSTVGQESMENANRN